MKNSVGPDEHVFMIRAFVVRIYSEDCVSRGEANLNLEMQIILALEFNANWVYDVFMIQEIALSTTRMSLVKWNYIIIAKTDCKE